jgi:hypothetical protein
MGTWNAGGPPEAVAEGRSDSVEDCGNDKQSGFWEFGYDDNPPL